MKTIDEITNALECCMGCNCNECPYADYGEDECKDMLICDTLILINRMNRKKGGEADA